MTGQKTAELFGGGGKVEGLAILQKERGHANDASLGIENGGAAGALGDRGTDLEHVPLGPRKLAAGGDDSLGQGSLKPQGTADNGDAGTSLSRSVGSEKKERQVFGGNLKQGEIVARVGRDGAGDRKKTAIFRFGNDGVGFGDDVLVRNEKAVWGNEKAGASANGLTILVLQNEEIDSGAGPLSQSAQIGRFAGGEGEKGSEKKQSKQEEGHEYSLKEFCQRASSGLGLRARVRRRHSQDGDFT